MKSTKGTHCCNVCNGACGELGEHKYSAWKNLDATQHQRVCERVATHVEKATHTWDAGKVTKTESVPRLVLVAKATAKGKITVKKTGTAVIYVQTINGIWKTCKVTVK